MPPLPTFLLLFRPLLDLMQTNVSLNGLTANVKVSRLDWSVILILQGIFLMGLQGEPTSLLIYHVNPTWYLLLTASTLNLLSTCLCLRFPLWQHLQKRNFCSATKRGAKSVTLKFFPDYRRLTITQGRQAFLHLTEKGFYVGSCESDFLPCCKSVSNCMHSHQVADDPRREDYVREGIFLYRLVKK